MSKITHKKVWSQYFEQILSGRKKFELRLADFDVQEGDVLVLQEWDQATQKFTGRSIEVIATYVLKTKNLTFWTKKDIKTYGFQVIQFEPLQNK
jgi:ASC-1-like (ASCH) protein